MDEMSKGSQMLSWRCDGGKGAHAGFDQSMMNQVSLGMCLMKKQNALWCTHHNVHSIQKAHQDKRKIMAIYFGK